MASQGQIFLRGTSPFLAGEAIAANLLVTFTTVANTVGLCGASGVPLGINATNATIASGAIGDVQILAMGDRVLSVSSATITKGDFVKGAAAGQVAPEASVAVRTANTIGIAETSVTGSGLFFWRVAP